MTLGLSQETFTGADNSNLNNDEPSKDDNSNELLEDNEPETDEDSEVADKGDDEDEQDDNKEELILGKFKTVEDLAKSYEEKEKLTGTQSTELGELRKKAEKLNEIEKQQNEIAKMYGFDTVEELNNHKAQVEYNSQMAKIEADEYIQYLKECEYPDEVKSLLIQYQQNPSKELLESIEAEFPIGVIKKVAESVAGKKGQLEAQVQQAQFQQVYEHTENYLKNVTTKYADEFKNKEFVSLFGEAFKVLGANLDADVFISKLNSLKTSWINDHETGKNIRKENQDATDVIEGASPKGTSQSDKSGSEKSILDMNPDEIAKEYKKYK